MNLLITGATGFVGRNLLLSALRDERFEQILLHARNAPKLRAQLSSENVDPADHPRLRLLDAAPPSSAPLDEVTHAVHAVGVSFACERKSYEAANVDPALALTAALPTATRLIVLSSQSAGGPTPADQPARQITDPDAPITLYGKSKLEMERQLLAARPDTAIWRPPMILGPRDAATVPLFQMARSLVQIKPGFVPKSYSWISVNDLANALLTALTSTAWNATVGRPIYTGSPTTITDLDLVQTATRLCNRTPYVLRLPSPAIRLVATVIDAIPPLRSAAPSLTRDRVREIYADRWVIDSSEFQTHFLQTPASSLESTLTQTRDWLKAHG